MKDRKVISLHKALFQVLFVIVGGIVLFLCILETYLLQSYRKDLQSEWREALDRYAKEIQEDLDEISSDLYDIYYYDPNYQMLGRILGIEAFPYAHELEERLKTRLLLKDRAAGYLLYFDDLKIRRYFFSQDAFSGADLEELKGLTSDLSGGSGVIRNWYYPVVNGKAFAAGIYRNNHVSLCEIYCLETLRKDLETELGEKDAKVFYEYDGDILGDGAGSLPEDDFLGCQDEVKGGFYLLRKQIKGTDLVFHLAVPVSVWTYLNSRQVVVIVITALVILFSSLFYLRLRRELFHPLDSLTMDMLRIGGGDWSGGIHTKSRFLEIQQVIETTERMIEEIEAQKLLTYEKTILEQKARMQYLSLQLNPHFYLNGLKTLNYLALRGDNERIQEIIFRLSVHLRYLLQREDEMVILAQEIEFVKSYVSLYREMTDREIDVEWKTDEDTLECLVPRLCIQTFVENSFKYARVGKNDSPLQLFISTGRFASGQEEYVEILVRDNGEGYRENLLAVLNEPPEEGGISVGINNLKRRCAFLFEKEVQYAFYNDSGAVNDIFYPWLQSRAY